MNNKKVAQEFHNLILNESRYDEAENLVHGDVVFSLNQDKPLVGIEAFKGHMSPIQHAFPDLKYVTECIIQENDTVALYWVSKGTHTQPLGDIPATGKNIELKGLSLFRLKDEKITENLVFFNETEIPKQLGIL